MTFTAYMLQQRGDEMKREPQIFTTIDAQDVPVSDAILDTLEQEVVQETLLRECVRELLSESAKGPRDLPRDISVKIDPDPHGVTITYTSSDGGPPSMYSVNPIVGEVILEILPPDEPLGPCGGAWMIGSTQATKGWGPMLYDVAMEYATMNGGGLISDRGSVSPYARRVWEYYMANRGDVTGIQMDDLKNTLTPEEQDNCNQRVAMKTAVPAFTAEKSADTRWVDSPLSKRWTKPPTTIEALKAAGKLIWQEGGAYAPTKDLDAEGMQMVESYIRELIAEKRYSPDMEVDIPHGLTFEEMSQHLSRFGKMRLAATAGDFDPKQLYETATEWKPAGLWYGFGASWTKWLIDEDMSMGESYTKVWNLQVDASKLALMDSMKKIEDFTRQYGKRLPGTPAYGDSLHNLIDWKSAASGTKTYGRGDDTMTVQDAFTPYSGIEFNPYPIGKARDKFMWYSGIDMPSGCVWDLSAIMKHDLVAEKKEDGWEVYV